MEKFCLLARPLMQEEREFFAVVLMNPDHAIGGASLSSHLTYLKGQNRRGLTSCVLKRFFASINRLTIASFNDLTSSIGDFSRAIKSAFSATVILSWNIVFSSTFPSPANAFKSTQLSLNRSSIDSIHARLRSAWCWKSAKFTCVSSKWLTSSSSLASSEQKVNSDVAGDELLDDVVTTVTVTPVSGSPGWPDWAWLSWNVKACVNYTSMVSIGEGRRRERRTTMLCPSSEIQYLCPWPSFVRTNGIKLTLRALFFPLVNFLILKYSHSFLPLLLTFFKVSSI